MLRAPQHERKNINDINSFPFVPSINSGQALSTVEGLLRVFQQPARADERDEENCYRAMRQDRKEKSSYSSLGVQWERMSDLVVYG
jgi:hypothetical protein